MGYIERSDRSVTAPSRFAAEKEAKVAEEAARLETVRKKDATIPFYFHVPIWYRAAIAELPMLRNQIAHWERQPLVTPIIEVDQPGRQLVIIHFLPSAIDLTDTPEVNDPQRIELVARAQSLGEPLNSAAAIAYLDNAAFEYLLSKDRS